MRDLPLDGVQNLVRGGRMLVEVDGFDTIRGITGTVRTDILVDLEAGSTGPKQNDVVEIGREWGSLAGRYVVDKAHVDGFTAYREEQIKRRKQSDES